MRYLLALLAVVACDAGAKQKTPSPTPAPGSAPTPAPEPSVDLTVKMERTRCYGTCPAYTVSIAGNGAVTFTGEAHVAKQQGSRKVSLDLLRGIGALADVAHFFELHDRYVDEGCTSVWTDSPTTTITITRGGKTKSIERYHGCGGAPPAFDQLAETIDLASGTAEWIGTPEERAGE